jgi:hypothetical protein
MVDDLKKLMDGYRMPCILAIMCLIPMAANADITVLDKNINVEAQGGREFQGICYALQIPCAIEIDLDRIPQSSHREIFSVKNKKAKEAVRLALKRYPKHKGTYKDGLLRIFPNDRLANSPLDMPLGKIEFHNQDLDALRAIFAKRVGISDEVQSLPIPINPHPRLFSFAVDDATARQVLDAAVIHHAHVAWITRHMTTGFGAFTYLELFDYDLKALEDDADK